MYVCDTGGGGGGKNRLSRTRRQTLVRKYVGVKLPAHRQVDHRREAHSQPPSPTIHTVNYL